MYNSRYTGWKMHNRLSPKTTPGTVQKILVSPGDKVKKGNTLVELAVIKKDDKVISKKTKKK